MNGLFWFIEIRSIDREEIRFLVTGLKPKSAQSVISILLIISDAGPPCT